MHARAAPANANLIFPASLERLTPTGLVSPPALSVPVVHPLINGQISPNVQFSSRNGVETACARVYAHDGSSGSCCACDPDFFSLSPSSVFLAEQFESLQSHLDAMMPAAKKPFLQQFYSQASFIHVPLQPFCVTLQLTPMSKGVGPSLRFLPRVVIT